MEFNSENKWVKTNNVTGVAHLMGSLFTYKCMPFGLAAVQ